MKTQNIRLIDVFLLGPFMVWAGSQMKNDTAGVVMTTAGIATILYNGNNYLKVQENETLLER